MNGVGTITKRRKRFERNNFSTKFNTGPHDEIAVRKIFGVFHVGDWM